MSGPVRVEGIAPSTPEHASTVRNIAIPAMVWMSFILMMIIALLCKVVYLVFSLVWEDPSDHLNTGPWEDAPMSGHILVVPAVGSNVYAGGVKVVHIAYGEEYR